MPKVKKKAVKVKGETLVNFILDKSGSMESVRRATISGFNEYLQTLKRDGNKYSFTLTLFDTAITRPFVNSTINNVDNLNEETYQPNGGTALYDAVCGTIRNVSEKKGQKVINIIMTDGEENSSKEYTQDDMKSLIKERENKGNWTFVYLGANQDSYANAQKFGFSKMNTSNFNATGKGVQVMMATLSTNTRAFAGNDTLATSAFFSASDQSNLASAGTGDVDSKISSHFSTLGKKSWEKRKKGLLDK